MPAIAAVLALLSVPRSTAAPGRTEFLEALHDGRFDAGRRLLTATPGAGAEQLFFEAFVTYWRLVFDDTDEQLQSTLDGELAAALAAAGDDGDALWSGSAHLLLAELRASQRRPLAAAYEAKKAKKLLESASLEGDAAADALFGLGTYNYVADAVPSYVKGLRALLFLPKGDRALGLSELEQAAAGSAHFRLEARTLLVTVYASKHERLYERAIDERNRLVAEFPDAIASLYASARLDLSLGRNASALSALERAERRARELDGVDPVVLRSLDLLRARAELAAFRPDRALAVALGAVASGAGLTPSIRSELEDVRAAASRDAAGVSWPRDDGGAPDFGAAAAHSDRPILALLAGDVELRAGRAQAALDWLKRADDAALSPGLQAGRAFREGQAQDLLGERELALAAYRRAASIPGFSARDGAAYYQQSPYGSTP
jgi:hypothetical protein